MDKRIRRIFLNIVYVFTPLLCIFAGETTKLAFLFELKNGGVTDASFLHSLIMSLSLVGIPILGLFSDKNCRKKTLTCLVLFELSALFLLSRSQFVAATIQGLIGAGIVAVSRAAYLDVRPFITHVISKNNLKISDQDDSLLSGIAVVETIIIQAIAWTFHSFFAESNLIIISESLFIFSIFMLIIFTDLRDRDARLCKHEISLAKKEYLRGYSWQLLVAFFLYDCAFQTPNYFSEANYNTSKLSQEIDIIGCGIFIGCIAVWLILLSIYHVQSMHHLVTMKEKMMFRIRKSLFYASILLFSVFLFPFIKWRSLFHSNVGFAVIFFFACIGGVILALIFVYFTNKVKAHERGLLYGILEEVEILAEAIVPIFVYNFLAKGSLTNIPFIILIGVGLLCIRKYNGNKTVVRHHILK